MSLLSTSVVAILINKSPAQARRLMRSGAIKSVKVGSGWVTDEEGIKEYKQKCMQGLVRSWGRRNK